MDTYFSSEIQALKTKQNKKQYFVSVKKEKKKVKTKNVIAKKILTLVSTNLSDQQWHYSSFNKYPLPWKYSCDFFHSSRRLIHLTNKNEITFSFINSQRVFKAISSLNYITNKGKKSSTRLRSYLKFARLYLWWFPLRKEKNIFGKLSSIFRHQR